LRFSKEFNREGPQRWPGPQPKEFYREDAKVAKLREAERGSLISEILGVETRNCGISTKDAKLREEIH